jgi:hypothetical protein
VKPELNHERFCRAIIEAFEDEFENCRVDYIDTKSMLAQQSVRQRYEELSGTGWIFDRASKADVTAAKKFDFGLFEVTLKRESGRAACIVNSDCLATEVVQTFEEMVNGFTAKRVWDRDVLDSMGTEECKDMIGELVKWISPEIEKQSYVK